jgi:hypothetical protein
MGERKLMSFDGHESLERRTLGSFSDHPLGTNTPHLLFTSLTHFSSVSDYHLNRADPSVITNEYASKMAALPEITPFPTPILLNDLVERQQQVTTISVVASSTPSGVDTGSNTTEKKGFPVAVAIPALVGGMAAAFGAFGLWWWCTKRGKRQRRVGFSFLCPWSLTSSSPHRRASGIQVSD